MRRVKQFMCMALATVLTVASINFPVYAANPGETDLSEQEIVSEVVSEETEEITTENSETIGEPAENSESIGEAIEEEESEAISETSENDSEEFKENAGNTYAVRYEKTFLIQDMPDEIVGDDDILKVPTSEIYMELPGYYIRWIWYWSGSRGYGRTPGSEVKVSTFSNLSNGAIISVSPEYFALTYDVNYVLEPVDKEGNPIPDELSPAENNQDNPTFYQIDDSKTLLVPTKKGYTFGGWYSDPEYKTPVTSLGNDVMYGDITLYAKWFENYYTINFDAKDGTPDIPSKIIKYTENYALPGSTASQKGYRMKYWTLSGSDRMFGKGEIVNRLTSEPNGIVTLEAYYANDFGYVEYVLEPLDSTGKPIVDEINPAVNAKDNIYTYVYGNTFTFKNPVKTGYTFDGWYTDKDYKNKITEIKSTDKNDFILYAKWIENEYTIKIHFTDSKTDNYTVKYTENYTIPGDDYFVRSGYRFQYLCTSKTWGAGVVYKKGEVLSRLTDLNGGVIDLYAKWNKKHTSPATSYNVRSIYNSRWANPVRAYLYKNEDSTFTRVEYISNYTSEEIAVEKYSATGTFKEGFTVPKELSEWGGFYSGSKYNFLVFGEPNPNESNSKEVVRIVRYTKDWIRVDHCTIKDANVWDPFDAGSLRMVENGNKLYVHTCREMYASGDGLHHQSNMTFEIEVTDKEMKWTNELSYIPFYTSHSFNQFIVADGNDIVVADHGDAYPRAVTVQRMSTSNSNNYPKEVLAYEMPGKTGENSTGVFLGGLETSSKGYLVAFNSVDFSNKSNYSFDGQRNIFIAFLDRENFDAEHVNIIKISSYSASSAMQISEPSLVKIDDNKFMLLWQVTGDAVKYVFLNEVGEKISSVGTLSGVHLSDMQPILVGEKVIWYETNGEKPVFHSIGECKVSFDSCGGTPVDTTFKIVSGAKYSSVITEFPTTTKVGYEFEGWYTEKEGGKKVTLDTAFKGISDTVLYAHWKAATFTVSFDTDCEIKVEPITVTYEQPYGTLPTVDRYGYELTGWYTEKEGGSLVTAETIYTLLDDSTLYARYKEVKYINFDANGGYIVGENDTVLGSSLRVAFDLDEGTRPIDNVYKLGSEFVGWFTAPEGGEEFNFGDVLTEHITLYAHYEYNNRVATVDFSRDDSTTLAPGTKIELSCATSGAAIYYYADTENIAEENVTESFIRTNGTLYNGTIELKASVNLYAIAVKDGYGPSFIECMHYSVYSDAEFWGDIDEEDQSLFVDATEVPEGIWIGIISDCVYNSKACLPQVRVYDGKVLLTEKKDYTVKYKNNVKAGEATVTVTGKGNYKGSKVATFTIYPATIEISDIEVMDAVANEKVIKPSVKVSKLLNGKKVVLKNGKDYIVSLDENDTFIDAKDYEVKVEGINNFAGSLTTNYTIHESTAVLFSKVSIAKIPDVPYSGDKIVINAEELTVKYGTEVLVPDKDFEVVDSMNSTEIGTASLVVRGLGRYKGTKTVTFKIVGTSIAKAVITDFEKVKYYTGEPVLQDASLELNGAALTENHDYVVVYDKNTAKGTATVVYKGIGEYTGTIKKTYKIDAYDLASDSEEGRISVDYDYDYNYCKGGVKPEPVVTYTYEDVTYVMKKDVDYTLKYKNNTSYLTEAAVEAGKMPELFITGKGNFKGKFVAFGSLYFDIHQKDLSLIPAKTVTGVDTITATDIVYQNKAGICKPTIALYDENGKKLVAGTDYKSITYTYGCDVIVDQVVNKVRISKLKKAGEPVDKLDIIPADTEIVALVKAVESSKCNYIGETQVSFRFVKANISKAKVVIAPEVFKQGGVYLDKSKLTVTLNKEAVAASDYEIVSYKANDKAGTATITLKGVGNLGGVKTQTFKITPYIWQ